jgi:hypothetical protein
MQTLSISIVGNLSVTISGGQKSALSIAVSNQQTAVYSYCPQTNSVTVLESVQGVPQLALHYPAHFQLREVVIRGARVVIENVVSSSLTISVSESASKAILLNNSLERLTLRSDARNIIDMTQQALPKRFSHHLAKETIVRMPNQGPPTCIVCFENEITQLFVACSHWCLCSACSAMTSCPVCRKEGAQLRVYQQSATHFC